MITQIQKLFAGQSHIWLAQDFYNQARVDYLQASLYVDKYYSLSIIPVELKQSFRPLCALQSADNLINSVIGLLTAGNLLVLYGDISDEDHQIIDNCFTVWSEIWQSVSSLASKATALAELIQITAEIDSAIAVSELAIVKNKLAELNEILDQLTDNIIDRDKIKQADLLKKTYNDWVSSLTSSSLANIASLSISPDYRLSSDNQPIDYKQQSDKLKNATSDATVKSSHNSSSSYTTRYNTELANDVIQIFLWMRMPALFEDDTPPSPVTVNPMSSGNHEYDALFMAALDAAERRNSKTNPSTSKLPQVSGFTGDEDLDDLLAIISDQIDTQGSNQINKKTYAEVNINITSDLLGRINEAVAQLENDPQISSYLTSKERDADFNHLDLTSDFFNTLNTGDHNQKQPSTVVNILQSSLKTQVQSGVLAVSHDQKTLNDSIKLLSQSISISDLVEDIQMRLVVHAIHEQLDNMINEFSENPELALNKALVRLITQLGDDPEYADWTSLLSGIQKAANSDEFWHAIANTLTGDVDALLNHVFDTFIADSNDGQAMLNRLVTELETVTDETDNRNTMQNTNREPTAVKDPSDDINLSGYYKIELSLLSFDYAVKPYNPNNRLGNLEGVQFENKQVEDFYEDIHGDQGNKTTLSEHEWQELALKEQDNIKQQDDFRKIEATIEVWHNPETDQLSASLSELLSLGVPYQQAYELQQNNETGYKTIYFEPLEENMAHGYLSFVPWAEGETEIEGELTVYFDGMLNHLERTFRIDGYQISD